MKIKVYSRDNCPRCKKTIKKLEEFGAKIEHHSAEYHRNANDNWREDGSVDAMAAMAYVNDEMPAIVCDGLYMTTDEAIEMAKNDKWNAIIDYAKENGWWVDREILDDVEKNGYNCPCKINKIPCPCPAHKESINKNGSCGCGLFMKESK